MKSFIIVSFILVKLLVGSDNYTLKLFETIIPYTVNFTPVAVYVDDEVKTILASSKVFKIVSNCTDANVLIGKTSTFVPKKCLDKPLFATSYKGYKNSQNSFGAFYWRKGRPQIRFNKTNLDKYNIKLSNKLSKYIK